MNIDEMRNQEDNEIVEHLKTTAEIVLTKCKRCNSMAGCLGCTFSTGDGIRGYIRESLKMMIIQRPTLIKDVKHLIDTL